MVGFIGVAGTFKRSAHCVGVDKRKLGVAAGGVRWRMSNKVRTEGKRQMEVDAKQDVKPEEGSQKKDEMAVLELLGWKMEVPGKLVLLSVPILWGSFGPAVRFLYGVEHAPRPSLFNAERLTLSAIVYSIVLYYQLFVEIPKEEPKTDQPEQTWKEKYAWVIGGVELGTYVFLANVAQVVGLQSVAAGRAAFLNQMQTVIVPFLGLALGIEKNLSPRLLISSALAVGGVAVLAADSNPEIVASFKGDLLELTSALFFSLYILRVRAYSEKTKVPLLVAGKIIVQAFFAWVWTIQSVFFTSQTTVHFFPDGGVKDVLSWMSVVLWTGLMSSALSGWLQTSAQKVVTPSEAAVVFASQPLVAAALSWILLGESLDFQASLGGLIIVAATVLSSIKPKGEKDVK